LCKRCCTDGQALLVKPMLARGMGTQHLTHSDMADGEKQAQIDGLAQWQTANAEASKQALAALQHAALTGGNVFAALMDAAKVCSLGQMSAALYQVGGQYRRNM
jgi:methylmalonyl-CoA mutase N-terminal domain/subunit